MFKRSRFVALILAVVLSCSFAVPTYAAVTGRIYGDEDIIDDDLGLVWEKIDGKWKCTDLDGEPVTGWAERKEYTYYLGKDGFVKTGWIKDKGNWYYLYSEDDDIDKDLYGTLAKNTTIDNYYVDEKGVMKKILKKF